MYRRTTIFLGVLLLTALAGTPAGAAPAARHDTGHDSGPDSGRQLRQLLDAEHAAGMPGVFAEVRDGRPAWRGASGVADLDTGRPVRPGFQQRVGSITKSFVATTVLQLTEERRLRLDDAIGRYLPDVVTGDVGRQVTIRMLLNHTSGIGDYVPQILDTPENIERYRHESVSPRRLAALGLAAPRTNPPGAGWSYSNTNYILAGLLIERVTGRPATAEVTRRVIRPLGLADTYFPGTDPYIRGPHSKAYLPWTDGTLRDFSVYNYSIAWTAGALISTTSDLDRFYRALLTGKLLRPASLAAMQTAVPIDPAHPEAGGYGLGLFWVPLPCGRAWGHDGGVIGMLTLSLHSPDGRRQASLAENLSNYATNGQEHPIDRARAAFTVAALCGGTDAAATAATPTIPRISRLIDR
jgi:D-alanyl-D-alanine carboxypeptidase